MISFMKTVTVRIDKAGRLVLPKPLRDQFNLLPGDKLCLSVEGNGFRLEPAEACGKFTKKGTVLAFAGKCNKPITTEMVNEIIDEVREERNSADAGKRPDHLSKSVKHVP
jgi:AbrB family looped-hinge helix DNA binding protein